MAFYIAFDAVMALLNLGFGIYFFRSDGRAANLLSGYNLKSRAERSRFDEAKLCRAYGRLMMLGAIPFAVGALIDGFQPGLGCVLAWGGWLILFVALLVLRSKLEK